jgi:hypothetical protein
MISIYKATRNFKGYIKGQIVNSSDFPEETVKLMIKRGFIKVEKLKKAKSKKVDK